VPPHSLHERTPIISSPPPRIVLFTDRKLQMKFKHASVLGIEGNYNQENARKFREAIRTYIEDPAVEQIVGTFRGDPVIHYYHKARKINAMTEHQRMGRGRRSNYESRSARKSVRRCEDVRKIPGADPAVCCW
jgi:hypothetical protein